MNCVVACDCPGAPRSHELGCLLFKERKHKTFYAVTDSRQIRFVTGFECHNSNQWWVPELGYTMTVGHHLFATSEDARLKALEEIAQARILLNSQEEQLTGDPCDEAHSVPFACQPDKTVVEKFTVEIQTPESPDYCGCERCRTARAEFWTVLIEHKLQHCADHSDPLRIFPEKHKIHLAGGATLNQ